jgi:hypothetical protein
MLVLSIEGHHISFHRLVINNSSLEMQDSKTESINLIEA